MKRDLNDEERKVIEKQLPVATEEVEHLKFLNKHNQLMLDEGLESNYKEKIRGFKKNKKQLTDEIFFMDDKVANMKKQLDEGVEVKVIQEVKK